VRYLQADAGYVSVVYPGGELLIEDSLRALEEEFVDTFLRIHRNTLVAIAHVAGLTRDALGNTEVAVTGVPGCLPVSRRLAGEVRRRLR
jgi:two-component system response regulator AlgR